MLLTSFYIDNHKFDVCTDEASASLCDDGSSFVLSLEDIRAGLRCFNIDTCAPANCPVYAECTVHTNNLPYVLITAHCPELLLDYPEYLI